LNLTKLTFLGSQRWIREFASNAGGSALYTSRKSTFESATYADLPRTTDGLQFAQ